MSVSQLTCCHPPRPHHRFTGVHALQAGLWGRTANVTEVSGVKAEWGKVYREAQGAEIEGATPAYAVGDIAAMYNVPAWDLVKIDIEGVKKG